jgi:competence protein ComEA
LVASNYNDGDSFHVSYKGKEHIIRLYFVDCPETDATYPARVAEQVAHHGVTSEQALAVGRHAKKYSAALLSKPFTVVTCNQDARGNSQLPRIFGFITTSSGDDLGELLVGNGLARSYGAAEAPPGKQVAQLRARYDQLEEQARRKKLGVYGSDPLREIETTKNVSGKVEPESRLLPRATPAASASPSVSALPTPSVSAPPLNPESQVAASGPERAARLTPVVDAPAVIDGRVNINSASLEELMTLPEVGASMAQKIIDERPYATIEEIERVKGIGPKKFEVLKSRIFCD